MRNFSEPHDPHSGYVYIFHVHRSDSSYPYKEPTPTKIGFCHWRQGEPGWVTVDRRLRDIQRHHWEYLLPWNSKALDAANLEEYIIHCKYKKYRIKGEWFNLTFRQIKNIKKYLNSQVNSELF